MKYYGTTDRGLVRKNNQDSYVIATNEAGDVFALVCDGIGGSRGGDIASHMAVSYFSEVFADNQGFRSSEEVKEWLHTHIQIANEQIYRFGSSSPQYRGMGTTLCGVLLCPLGRFVVNIGDSRAYAWNSQGAFRRLTVDHTLVADMIMHGELSKEEAENYPRKNVLTNALGVWETIRSDIDTHPEEMAGILICSDGLHGYVKEPAIRQIVLNKELDPSLKARKLVRASLEAGGFDNVTVVLIGLEGADAQ